MDAKTFGMCKIAVVSHIDEMEKTSGLMQKLRRIAYELSPRPVKGVVREAERRAYNIMQSAKGKPSASKLRYALLMAKKRK